MSRCPNCMNELTDRNCSNCGYPLVELASVKDALPVGTQLNNRYELGNALGKNIQSIAYIAYDAVQANPVIILEFYPKSVVTRKFNDVIIRGSRDLYVEACRLYLTSDKVQPLMKLDSFAENNTVYRVYQLNGHSAQAIEEAEVLLDDPILFRNNIGKPVMSINALAIPQMPRTRAWSLSKRIQGEKKRRAIRNMLVAAVAVTIVALVGFFVYDMFRMHEVTIVVQSHKGIKTATFADQILPGATTDPETNSVSYKVSARKGSYVFTAETEDNMHSGAVQVSVNKAVTQEVVMPTPSPTPVPDFGIQPDQWMIQENEKYWIYDEKSGEKTEPIGNPAKEIKIVDIKVNADLAAVMKRKNAELFIKRGEAKHVLTFKEKIAGATVSEGEYELYLDDGRGSHKLLTLNAACNYQATVDKNAIEFYLENVRDYDKTEPVVFVANECTHPDFVMDAEELDKWAELYPMLFESVKQYPLNIEVDPSLEKATIEIEGKGWEQGDPVTISSDTNKIKVVFCLDGREESEEVPVSADSGSVVIGSKIAGKKMEDRWKGTEKIIEAYGCYHLILNDGDRIKLTEQEKKDKFDEALIWFKQDFDEKILKGKKDLNLAFDPTVDPDYISAVTLDGVELSKSDLLVKDAAGKDEIKLSVKVTPGTYELKISFANGLEPVTMQINTNNIPRQKLLADQRMKLVQFANNAMKQQKVYGAVEIGGEYYYLPVKANEALEEMDAETYIRYTQVYAKALDKDPWIFVPVDIYVDERIETDMIRAIDVEGIEIPKASYGDEAYAQISATVHKNYKVHVALEGSDKAILERKNADEDPENGINEWHLLGETADKKLKALRFWGLEAENIELLEGDTEYLTQEAIEKAKAEAELYKLTVKGAIQEGFFSGYKNVMFSWYKYVVKYAKDNADTETEPLEPVVTEDDEFSVIMTQGNYAIYAVEKEGEKEFLLAVAEMNEDVVINLDAGDLINTLGQPIFSPTPEPTPTPTPKPHIPQRTKGPATSNPITTPTPEPNKTKSPVTTLKPQSYSTPALTPTTNPAVTTKATETPVCETNPPINREPETTPSIIWPETSTMPTEEPSTAPKPKPTVEPMPEPTLEPTMEPTPQPTAVPKMEPVEGEAYGKAEGTVSPNYDSWEYDDDSVSPGPVG